MSEEITFNEHAEFGDSDHNGKDVMMHSVASGKYTIIFHQSTGRFECLRYGEKWRELTGDGMVLAMLQEIDFLKEQREIDNLQLNSLLSEVDHLTIQNKLLSQPNRFGKFIVD